MGLVTINLAHRPPSGRLPREDSERAVLSWLNLVDPSCRMAQSNPADPRLYRLNAANCAEMAKDFADVEQIGLLDMGSGLAEAG